MTTPHARQREVDTLVEVRRRTTTTPMPGMVYLALSHGRECPTREPMASRGTTGPFIGPLLFCHVTYNNSINLGFVDGYETGPTFHREGIGFFEELLFFDGVYYGEWKLHVAESPLIRRWLRDAMAQFTSLQRPWFFSPKPSLTCRATLSGASPVRESPDGRFSVFIWRTLHEQIRSELPVTIPPCG